MPEAQRIYWTVRAHGRYKVWKIELRELAARLGLPFARFKTSAFHIRTLQLAQQQLAATDLPVMLVSRRQKSRFRIGCFAPPSPAVQNFTSDAQTG